MSTAAADARPSVAARLSARGPLFVEAAHALYLRPDLAPGVDWTGLTFRCPPMPTTTVRDVLSRALGRAPEHVFDSLSPVPSRSEPFVQVHDAVLAGAPVRVKVLRPGVRADVAARDQWARQLRRELGQGRGGGETDLEDDVAAWLERRIDLTAELGVLQRLHALRPSRFEVVPRPYPELSGEEVLVVESLPGVALSELGVARRGGAAPTMTSGTSADLAGDVVATALSQVVRRGFFQQDFIANNVVGLPSGEVSFYDYCHVVEVAPSTARQQLTYLGAVFDGDVSHMFPPLDPDQASEGEVSDFRRALLRTVGDASPGGGAYASGPSQPRQFLTDLLRLSGRSQIALADGSAAIYGAVAGALAVSEGLAGPENAEAIGRSYLRNARLQAANDVVRSEQLEHTGTSLVALLRDSPGQLHQLLSDLADGTFSLKVTAAENPPTARARDARVRLVVLAVVSVGLAVLLSTPHLPSPGGFSLAWPLGVLLVLDYAWIVLSWRRLR